MCATKKHHLAGLVTALLLVLAFAVPATPALANSEHKATLASKLKDGCISSQIELAYFLNPKINTFDVDVDVKNGEAYVIGYVPNEAERDKALSIAGHTHGVTNVVDRLMVDPNYKTKLAQGRFFDQNPHDYWMSREVKTRLLLDPKVAGTRIGVEAEDGVVTLRGSVQDMSEAKEAEKTASEVSGVKEVKDKIICCRM